MMDFARRFALAVVILSLAACGGGGGGGGGGQQAAQALQQTPSILCPDLVGAEGLAWDLYNGVLRTDSVLPVAPPAGPAYIHPGAPLLNFTHPTGYTPFTRSVSIQDFGVDLVRDDSQVVWRDYRVSIPGTVPATAIRDGEIQGVLNHLGVNGPITTVCARDGRGFDAFGNIATQSNIMFRVGNHTAIVLTTAFVFQGTGFTTTSRKVYLAPTAEFGARVLDTFLAIDYQMNLGDDSGFRDSDGDGWRDPADIEPLNPNEPTPGGLPR